MRENNIDIGEIMDQGKILLVNLRPSDHLSRQNAKVFGALLVNEFFERAFRREREPSGGSPRPFYLYIDEFQNFVNTPDIANMLDQVGKYGLRLILSHQRLGQVEREEQDVIDAVFTNIKNRAIFGGLRRDDAKLIAEECFVNQLDLRQVKKAIYQTKFWPVYGRDKVYASTEGYSTGQSTTFSFSTGLSTHLAPAEGWVDGIFSPEVLSTTESEAGVSGSAYSSGDSGSESEIDIPIFYPVPYEELTSEQTWPLEEQIWRVSEALKAQLMRHCFIQIPGEETQPMLVPFVKEFHVLEEDILEYEAISYERSKALTIVEADALMESEKQKLEQESLLSLAEPVEPESFREPKKARVRRRPRDS